MDDSVISRKRWYARKVLNAMMEVHCEQAVDENVAVDMVRNQLRRVAEDGSILRARCDIIDQSIRCPIWTEQRPSLYSAN